MGDNYILTIYHGVQLEAVYKVGLNLLADVIQRISHQSETIR